MLKLFHDFEKQLRPCCLWGMWIDETWGLAIKRDLMILTATMHTLLTEREYRRGNIKAEKGEPAKQVFHHKLCRWASYSLWIFAGSTLNRMFLAIRHVNPGRKKWGQCQTECYWQLIAFRIDEEWEIVQLYSLIPSLTWLTWLSILYHPPWHLPTTPSLLLSGRLWLVLIEINQQEWNRLCVLTQLDTALLTLIRALDYFGNIKWGINTRVEIVLELWDHS